MALSPFASRSALKFSTCNSCNGNPLSGDKSAQGSATRRRRVATGRRPPHGRRRPPPPIIGWHSAWGGVQSSGHRRQLKRIRNPCTNILQIRVQSTIEKAARVAQSSLLAWHENSVTRGLVRPIANTVKLHRREVCYPRFLRLACRTDRSIATRLDIKVSSLCYKVEFGAWTKAGVASQTLYVSTIVDNSAM